ncbi:hypothetical protein BDW59DRAFT_174056 [Aspergillus cavernicola]|uniref:Uncharacterized protein n=1 Tax=Aspergillus cavernicola TaxID=176166 RepID=A0ABR4I280_9EURO
MYSNEVLDASAAKSHTLAGGRGANALARSQRYWRSSRVGQVWRRSTSVSLMREGGVQEEPQELNWNSRSTGRSTNKHTATAIMGRFEGAKKAKALMMISWSKMDRLSREEEVDKLWLKSARTGRRVGLGR